MAKEKIAITLEELSISELDRLVKEKVFRNRSQVIQETVFEKIQRLKKTRLATESSKLNPEYERQLSEEGLESDLKEWPDYQEVRYAGRI